MRRKRKPIIDLDNVWKIYTMGAVEVPALRGLNIRIWPGEFVAIIGASGSGKSTTLNMVGCLDTPTKGNVYLDGKNISKLDEATLARIRGKKIGFVFQTFNLIPSLNALENITLPMIFQGITEEERIARAKRILTMVGLEKRMHHKPAELSGGERQRVAIARALANDPEVVLADEPTGNLDSVTGKQILSILCNLHQKEGRTIILITHDLGIAKCAQRIIKLTDGRVVK